MPMNLRVVISLLCCCVLFAGCKDLEDYALPDNQVVTSPDEKGGVYILCEGLYAQNSASLAYYDFKAKNLNRDIFLSSNGRKLGDTANDIQQYGGKLYVVVDNSGTIEVLDAYTAKSVKKILVRNENDRNRSPRYITFHRDKAYVACFDSTICRIDTASLVIEATTKAGAYPDGICVANGKLYVSNSGDRNFAVMGNTVSVIDIASFTKIREINVAANPYRILADSEGDVYLASRGDYKGAGPYVFQRIDSYTDQLVQTFTDIEALNFTICNDTAYIYSYDFVKQTNSIKSFDCRTETIIEDNFIKDDTKITTPYGIAVNRFSGDVYVADAGNFTITGHLYCFDRYGVYKFKLRDVGLNPNAMVFVADASNSGTVSKAINHVSRVLDYHPAPGQFIGERAFMPADKTIETVTYDEMLAKASDVLTDQQASAGVVSLGGWGGYVTLAFDEPIQNVTGAYDFKVLGNAYYDVQYEGVGGSSEPGIVLVSKDVNENGLADDPWYELVGSEYDSAATIHGYELTYYRPNPIGGDIVWKDNQGGTGVVMRNTYHKQASYYPLWENTDKLVFRGSRLADNGQLVNGSYLLSAYSYGYADGHPNSSEKSNFKIDWAVDQAGQPVYLDKIHFVRIYTAVNQCNSWLGEVSTEIAGVQNLHLE
jgi:YVTN family beta-propeller protein